ncbi:hypothetical protein, partial [uncultured Megasphaera sp.]|uniref:hypothetical protein n=1 Tax=uncultured Megasphaera sp. TaxID=165188 RepID=UPI002587608C
MYNKSAKTVRTLKSFPQAFPGGKVGAKRSIEAKRYSRNVDRQKGKVGAKRSIETQRPCAGVAPSLLND